MFKFTVFANLIGFSLRFSEIAARRRNRAENFAWDSGSYDETVGRDLPEKTKCLRESILYPGQDANDESIIIATQEITQATPSSEIISSSLAFGDEREQG